MSAHPLTVDDLPDEDLAYERVRQREIDDAADSLRAHEAAARRMQQPPTPQACHACTTKYAGAVCPTCKEERPAYTALKAMAKVPVLPAPLPPCTYFPKSLCGCEGRGTCLETV